MRAAHPQIETAPARGLNDRIRFYIQAKGYGWNGLRRLLVMCALTSGAGLLCAQVAKPNVVLPPTVEGDWVRTDEVGAGNYQVMTMKYPKAALTPEGERLLGVVSADPKSDGELNGHAYAFLQEEVPQASSAPHEAGGRTW
jgi:hypothetical protein